MMTKKVEKNLFLFFFFFWSLLLCWNYSFTDATSITNQEQKKVPLVPTAEESPNKVPALKSTKSNIPIPVIAGNQGEKILIAIVTSPNHFKARDAIRKTYGSIENRKKYNFDLKFFIGELPQEKLTLNNQINREDNVVRLSGFIESYHNLTEKALGIFNWGYDNGYSIVFKVDDDSFVRPDKLRTFLSKTKSSNLIAGSVVSKVKNIDNPKSKWYFRDQYPKDYLPKYVIGAGILLGGDGLKYLSAKRNTLTRYRVDDAALGIWVEPLKLNFQALEIDVYQHHIRPNSVVVNPANFNEMYALSRGEYSKVTLQICLETCLCRGSPKYRPDCFQEFSNSEYKDVVPRLSHMN